MTRKNEMGFILGGIPNENDTRDNRTQEEINAVEKIAQQRYIDKCKTFGDNRSEKEILRNLKTLRTIINDYVRDVASYGNGVNLPENYESQWLEKIKSASPVFYEYCTKEIKKDPTLLNTKNIERKFVIHNLFNRFLHE